MPEVATIIFDNSLNSQNQDYLPSRYVLQKEVIDSLITRIFENDSQSLIGLIPLSQKDQNDIITPTNSRKHLTTFLLQRDLFYGENRALTVFQAERSLANSELSEKTLYFFMATAIQNADEFFVEICRLAANGTIIKIVCFAEAREFGMAIAAEEAFENLQVVIVNPEDDFNSKVNDFFVSGNTKYSDPDIDEAIRRSLIEK